MPLEVCLSLCRGGDDLIHECVDIAVDSGISGPYDTRLRDQAATGRGYRLAVRTDNGLALTRQAFVAWATSKGVCSILIQPGRPLQLSTFKLWMNLQPLDDIHLLGTVQGGRSTPMRNHFRWQPSKQ